MPRELPKGVEVFSFDTNPPAEVYANPDGVWLRRSDLPKIEAATRERLEAEWKDGLEERMPEFLVKALTEQVQAIEERVRNGLLSEKAVEAAKDELRLLPGDYLRNFYIRKAITAALDSLDSKGEEGS